MRPAKLSPTTTWLRCAVVMCAAIIFLASAPVIFATEWQGSTTGNWNDDANWVGTQPTLTDAVFLRSGTQVATVTDSGEEAFRIVLAQGAGDNATLNVQSGDLTLATSGTFNGLITMGTSGGDAYLNISGGTLDARDLDFRAEIGNENELNISGGVFDLSGSTDLVANGTGLVSITGSTADIIVGTTTSVGATTTFDFSFDAGGVSSWDTGGAFTINNGANLIVDASAFTPGATTISLATYGSLGNAGVEFNESITAPTGYTADVVYGATSLDLQLTAVPEPSSLLLLSAASLGLVTVRRRRLRARK